MKSKHASVAIQSDNQYRAASSDILDGEDQVRFSPATSAHNINRPRRHKRSLFPHCIEQLVAREHAPGVRGQILQQAKFPHRCKNRPTLRQYSHRRGVDRKIAQAQHLWSFARLAKTAQHAAHASHQFARAEGLGNVIVSPISSPSPGLPLQFLP